MATLLKCRSASAEAEAAARAWREAGLDVIDVQDWPQATNEFGATEMVVRAADPEEAIRIARTLAAGARQALSGEAARSLSHDLRTPLSAMAGWVHLLEMGKLDEAGLKRVVARLQGNIDDQVRTIEKYLGSTTTRKDMADT